ncbi:MAG: copper chaperone PCu(A)C [Novosphingobium sp.]
MTTTNHFIGLSAVVAIAAAPIAAANVRVGALSIDGAWSRETAPGQSVGGAFMAITNSGARADRLMSGSSPVAGEVQLHTMTMDGGVMRMRQVQGGVEVPAHGRLELKPGGFHVMFIGLKHALRQGERVPLTLRFQRAGQVTVQVHVQPIGSMGPMEAMHGGH